MSVADRRRSELYTGRDAIVKSGSGKRSGVRGGVAVICCSVVDTSHVDVRSCADGQPPLKAPPRRPKYAPIMNPGANPSKSGE